MVGLEALRMTAGEPAEFPTDVKDLLARFGRGSMRELPLKGLPCPSPQATDQGKDEGESWETGASPPPGALSSGRGEGDQGTAEIWHPGGGDARGIDDNTASACPLWVVNRSAMPSRLEVCF